MDEEKLLEFFRDFEDDLISSLENNLEANETKTTFQLNQLKEDMTVFIQDELRELKKSSKGANVVDKLSNTNVDTENNDKIDILEEKINKMIEKQNGLEEIMKGTFAKLNDLVKVNNAIIKKLESKKSGKTNSN